MLRQLGKLTSIARYRYKRWSDGSMDRRYGLSTQGIHEPEDLDCVGDHGVHSTGHEPIQIPLFREMMVRANVDHERTMFIDFGSGKGRAIILAAHYPFRKIVGVEFSPTLDRTARRNVEIFRDQRVRCPEIELLCQDAATYELPNEPLLCFFYNPFGPEVLNRVLTNLGESLATNPREVSVLYRNPVWAECFDR